MRFKFYISLLIPLVLIVLLFILSNYLFLFPSIKNNIVHEKKIMIKELTHVALDIIDNLNNANKNSLTKEEIQTLALEQIRNINYGDDKKSYFWITDLAPTMIMHPYRHDLEGSDLSNYKDINGFNLFSKAVDIISKKGEGYLEYYWQWQDDSTKILPKLSYVHIYEEWDWIIGTGVYIGDIEIELHKFRNNELKSSVIISLLVLIFMFIVVHHSIKLEKQRLAAQQKTKLSEEKFRNLFQNSNDIIVVSNLNGVIIDINKKALTTYGLKYEDIVGKTTYEMMPKKYHKTIEERVKSASKKDLPPIEIELTPNKNQCINVEIKSSMLDIENNKVLVSTMRDITSRKIQNKKLLNTNQKLEASEKKFKTLSNITFEGIILHCNGLILEMNLSFTKMFGYEQNELLHEDCVIKLFDKESQKKIRHNIAINNNTAYEVTGIKKDGSKFPVEIEAKDYYNEEKGDSLRVAAFRDITERKMHEKQVLNAIISGEEKERTRIAKELHDGLGPYLSTMKFYFQWLGESDDNEKKKVIIEKGNKSMHEAITILREISNNLNPHILTNYGLMDAIAAFISKFDENELLEFEFTPIENEKINHNIQVALYRIVIEFLNNTLKHANASKIYITFKKVENNKLKMIFADNGVGFDYKQKKRKANGIGLLNIKNRISSLDGEMEIKTAPKKGFMAIIVLNI